MVDVTDDRFSVLNAVWLRKMAGQDAIEECTGMSYHEVGALLEESIELGLVRELAGQYLLTDDGRRHVLEYYESKYSELRNNTDLISWYDNFEGINSRFLKQVSAWQTEVGSSQEKAYARIIRLVERHITGLTEASKWIARYGHYAQRFRRSIERIDAGQTEYITSPMVDSLHNIWFEFHEDILAVLGRPRETLES